MTDIHIEKIAEELMLDRHNVQSAARLLEEGATVPFIARYRKEVTGGLDEVAVIEIRDRLARLLELDARRASILHTLEEQGTLTDELREKVNAALTLSVLEDIYLPYRPKRRTRGMAAREKGLEPLAEAIFSYRTDEPERAAASYIDSGKGVETIDDALAGARDIIAEWINENAETRAELRELFRTGGILNASVIKGMEEKGIKFKDYYNWEEPAMTAPSHRILAIRRGAAEGILRFRILPAEEEAMLLLERRYVRDRTETARQMMHAAKDSYRRLLSLSLETEIRLEIKTRADEEAVKIFAENLRNLLLAPPLGQKAVLALDPGLRTGCKAVALNPQGKLLAFETIYPLDPFNKIKESTAVVKDLAEKYNLEAIAVGNGTGGREAEAFVKGIDFGRPVITVMVNESGASVYSASEAARDEFPDKDITVRGAVSIGRRLMDPLAELVKIDPKSIGVGQYQHDVDQRLLKTALDDVVISCVNAVGVDVNTASVQILGYVSGLSARLAAALVACRDTQGPFLSRKDLMNVSGMGPKTFEQAAGFLRIQGGPNPLDASAVHPERYQIVESMAADCAATVAELIARADLREKIRPEKYITDSVGMPTLVDIIAELAKPGRDPRSEFALYNFEEGINDISDLEKGMRLPGVVTNVTAFGAFVDIGVHRDGLVHISEMADKFIKDPHSVVKVNQKIMVTVTDIDIERERISLSMKSAPSEPGRRDEKAADTIREGKKRQKVPPAVKKPRKAVSQLAQGLADWKKKQQ
ncbi:MAG: RNA-binding transcriptional accessory protein [Syntrophales bacterium]|jgi:uncharacterized protein|nr:RNA-binding transcriptional accessory protein [Syntrophales bacterium]MDY0043231.1 Tex family protein [Syntrophales bacterium]